mmetsp:Transcript_4766/g.9639  ORF Transcript_4766/g.9639 Transcript_4766/m.9639 type:complete len:161 (+) Transcript_4766:1355-1837(+)
MRLVVLVFVSQQYIQGEGYGQILESLHLIWPVQYARPLATLLNKHRPSPLTGRIRRHDPISLMDPTRARVGWYSVEENDIASLLIVFSVLGSFDKEFRLLLWSASTGRPSVSFSSTHVAGFEYSPSDLRDRSSTLADFLRIIDASETWRGSEPRLLVAPS